MMKRKMIKMIREKMKEKQVELNKNTMKMMRKKKKDQKKNDLMMLKKIHT